MKFSAREDIEVPVEAVFRAVTDFESFERSALRRGIQVQRVNRRAYPGTLIAWDAEFHYRGKKRLLQAELTDMDHPHRIMLQSVSGGIEGYFLVDLLELSRTRTRINVEMEMKPKTISSRLMIHSLRLAKNRLTKRFKERTGQFADEIEEQYKSGELG